MRTTCLGRRSRSCRSSPIYATSVHAIDTHLFPLLYNFHHRREWISRTNPGPMLIMLPSKQAQGLAMVAVPESLRIPSVSSVHIQGAASDSPVWNTCRDIR